MRPLALFVVGSLMGLGVAVLAGSEPVAPRVQHAGQLLNPPEAPVCTAIPNQHCQLYISMRLSNCNERRKVLQMLRMRMPTLWWS